MEFYSNRQQQVLLTKEDYPPFIFSPLKISRIAPPTRFTGSPYIEDFPNGQLTTTQNKVAFSEVSLVLYYGKTLSFSKNFSKSMFLLFKAPWCAESKIASKIYENIANVYGNRIFFSSINCWQPGNFQLISDKNMCILAYISIIGGECRVQYSNVPNWPTIMSYRSTGFGKFPQVLLKVYVNNSISVSLRFTI